MTRIGFSSRVAALVTLSGAAVGAGPLVLSSLLVPTGCGDPPASEEATPGCLAGNRSQCVMQMSLGDHFGCARLFDRTVWCWGTNDESQLGYATTDLCPRLMPNGMTQSVACHSYPFRVGGLDNVARVVAGGQFACALRTDGNVLCWGDNSAGQLGRGDTRSSMTPAPVSGLPAGVTDITLGQRHACALAGGTVFCWGAGDAGQLGGGVPSQNCVAGAQNNVEMTACETSPHPVLGLGRTRMVSAGFAHTCAIADDGGVTCWGANAFGQLGTGTAGEIPAPQPRPVMLAGATLHAAEVSAGRFHTCARQDDGAVLCWGRNDHGELGIEPARTPADHCPVACSPTPRVVETLPGAPKPMASDDGGVARDMGSAGDGGAGDAGDAGLAPDMMPPGKPVVTSTAPPVSVSAGGDFSCVRLGDRTARCWGADDEGQLGDGRKVMGATLPVVVIAHPGAAYDNPLVDVIQVVTGAAGACARLQDGSLRCWGSNITGALGDGDIAPVSGPVPVVW